jgi:hypothetical protein
MKALWMSMILSSVSALGPSAAWARESCGPLFEKEYAMNGRIEVEASALKGPKASDYAARITKIDSLLTNLIRPNETNVVVHDLMMFSSFSPVELTVYVGLRPGSDMGKKHENVNQTTLTHEYGHAIFETNLRAQIPGFKEISLRMHENSNDRFVPAILHLGFHELFADAVTLVTTKNPEALPELLSMRRKSKKQLEAEYEFQTKTAPPEDRPYGVEEQMPISKKYSREVLSLRGMRDGYSHHVQQKWQELIQDEYVRIDPYFIFLPARWHLWQVVKTRIDSENYQKTILVKVFGILKEEMIYAHFKYPETLSAADIEAINLRIIKKLDAALL